MSREEPVLAFFVISCGILGAIGVFALIMSLITAPLFTKIIVLSLIGIPVLIVLIVRRA